MLYIWCSMRLVVCSALLLTFGLAAFAACPNCWYVFSVQGQWVTAEQQPISPGMVLKPNVEYLRQPPTARFGSITLVADESHRITQSCDGPGGCDRRFKVPEAPEAAGSRSFLEAFSAWVQHPQRYVAAVSRDYGSLRDAVVRSNGSSADLTPVVSDLGKGDYWFKIERLQPGRDQMTPFGNGLMMVSWDPDRRGSATLPLPPGLYLIQITNAQGEATGSDAWALVRGVGDYARAKSAFDEIVNQTASWREDVPASRIHALYRARLEALAQ